MASRRPIVLRSDTTPARLQEVPDGDQIDADVMANAVAVVLTGLATTNNSGIVASDTILQALGKLQAQVTSKAPSESPTFTGAPAVPNLRLANVLSANANTLDYYEEGTWTPTIGVTTPGNLSINYATQVGRYTRIGNVCSIECRLVFTPTYTTASGDIRIEGLPFASLAQAGINYVGFVFTGNLIYPANTYVATGSIGSNISRVGLITSSSTVAPRTLRLEEAMPSGTAGIDLRYTAVYKV